MMAASNFGGGFLPQDSHFGADHGQNIQSPSKSKSSENSTRPVSVKQILDAVISPQDVTIPIDGIATNEITIVGCISNVKSAEISKLFSIEDGTGTIDAKMWNPGDEFSTYRDGIWVRIFGIIKPFNNNIQITINKMRQIVEFNEITYHNLAAIEAHLVLTRGVQVPGSADRTAKSMAGNVNDNQPSNYAVPANRANNSFGNGEFSSSPYNSYGAGNEVFCLYKEYNNTPKGAHKNDVIRTFRGKFDHKEVIKTNQYLIDEGYVYNTCDENHAKCTAF